MVLDNIGLGKMSASREADILREKNREKYKYMDEHPTFSRGVNQTHLHNYTNTNNKPSMIVTQIFMKK